MWGGFWLVWNECVCIPQNNCKEDSTRDAGIAIDLTFIYTILTISPLNDPPPGSLQLVWGFPSSLCVTLFFMCIQNEIQPRRVQTPTAPLVVNVNENVDPSKVLNAMSSSKSASSAAAASAGKRCIFERSIWRWRCKKKWRRWGIGRLDRYRGSTQLAIAAPEMVTAATSKPLNRGFLRCLNRIIT